ncbi:hypothetical protein ACFQZ4_08920 [Catellatospora coxensis]|uniref:Peptidase A4-like protein n=1 Tax=Catellatospora coxensis TaxID=310354 RepID=A0A8J3L4E4_9ACTN|nr:hypothetical protein [Catellatospora coxensis]GIG08391.1 hypothetical protein Cco03nite_50910 [Catellatospora coxensis]
MKLRRTLVALLTAVAAIGVAAVAQAPAAHAATPDRWAFAFMDNPVPPAAYLMDPTRQWKSDNIPNSTVSPLVVGRYRVKFPSIASANGVAHVTAVAGDPRWCQVWNYYASGADQIVEVQCYKYTGAVISPDWSAFTVMYSTSSGPLVGPGTYAYVQGKSTGGTNTSYNPFGLVNTVTHGGIGTGVYKVWLPGVSTGLQDGNLQVTAQHPNSPRRCKVDNWIPGGGGLDVVVRCYDHVGAPADSWFDLTYHRERSVYGAFNAPKYFAYLWSNGFPGPSAYSSVGSVIVSTPAGPNLQYVEFHKVGFREGHVQVTGYRSGASYCNLQNVWLLSGAVVIVRNVICWSAAGTPVMPEFFISYSSRV